MDFSTELTEYRRRIKYHIQKVIGIKPSRFKLKLIDAAFEKGGISSFADLGGVWGVHGAYTFYLLSKQAFQDYGFYF